MSLIKLTFDEAVNSAKNDALQNHFANNMMNGIYRGIGEECSASQSNGTITFRSGVISAYGRRVFVENGTSIAVALDSAKYGYVVARIDTGQNTVTLAKKEGSSSGYPSLTKNDLMAADGVYELPLCSYYKTSSSLTIGVVGVTYISRRSDDLSAMKGALQSAIDAKPSAIRTKAYYRTSVSSRDQCRTFNLANAADEIKHGIVFIAIGSTVVSAPLDLVRRFSGGLYLDFQYLETQCHVDVEFTRDVLYVTPHPDTLRCDYIFICY